MKIQIAILAIAITLLSGCARFINSEGMEMTEADFLQQTNFLVWENSK